MLVGIERLAFGLNERQAAGLQIVEQLGVNHFDAFQRRTIFSLRVGNHFHRPLTVVQHRQHPLDQVCRGVGNEFEPVLRSVAAEVLEIRTQAQIIILILLYLRFQALNLFLQLFALAHGLLSAFFLLRPFFLLHFLDNGLFLFLLFILRHNINCFYEKPDDKKFATGLSPDKVSEITLRQIQIPLR